jgi:hypothetical protein
MKKLLLVLTLLTSIPSMVWAEPVAPAAPVASDRAALAELLRIGKAYLLHQDPAFAQRYGLGDVTPKPWYKRIGSGLVKADSWVTSAYHKYHMYGPIIISVLMLTCPGLVASIRNFMNPDTAAPRAHAKHRRALHASSEPEASGTEESEVAPEIESHASTGHVLRPAVGRRSAWSFKKSRRA